MKRIVRLAGAAMLVGFAMTVAVWAGQKNATADKEGEKEGSKAKVQAAGEHVRSLPHFYDRLGLTPEQGEKISALREEYRQKIQPLEEQVDQLRKERDQAMHSALTPEQREKLDRFVGKADQKRGTGGERGAQASRDRSEERISRQQQREQQKHEKDVQKQKEKEETQKKEDNAKRNSR